MMKLRPARQRGFTLVSAVFLLVVILALGAAALRISSTQHRTSAQDLLGAQAYQAARAGIEWGAFNVLQNAGGISCSTGGTTNPLAMPAAAGSLRPFSVTVSCVRFAPVTEGDSSVTMYQLTSTASMTGVPVGAANYVERQITVTIAN